MSKTILSMALILFAITTSKAQSVGIGTTTPDASAILELKATNKGFLPPQMAEVQKTNIPSPEKITGVSSGWHAGFVHL